MVVSCGTVTDNNCNDAMVARGGGASHVTGHMVTRHPQATILGQKLLPTNIYMMNI